MTNFKANGMQVEMSGVNFWEPSETKDAYLILLTGHECQDQSSILDHDDKSHTLGMAEQRARRNWVPEDFVEQSHHTSPGLPTSRF